MDLTPDDDQIALVDATTDWCREHMPLDRARTRGAELWPQIETMGWTAMTACGMDLDHATEVLVFAELGRHLAPIALMSSAVAARWSGRRSKVALALPATDLVRVLDGDHTTHALGLFDRRPGQFAFRGQGHDPASLDPSTSIAHVDLPASVDPIDDSAALHLQLLAAAFAVGCADAARDMAADYAKVREQFERPIGWFQAVKHLCADMAVRAAAARSQLYYGACALDAAGRDAAFHIAAAKRLADEAALENGRANIQVHGGIGMTDEALPHLCLKRAHLLGFIAPADRAVLIDEAGAAT